MKKKAIIASSVPQKVPIDHQPRTAGAVIIGGDFQGLGNLRSLARQNVPTYLLDQGLCIGRFSRYTKRFTRCPSVREEVLFFNFLLDLARKENLNTGETVYGL